MFKQTDSFGKYSDVAIGSVVQRFRWIPAGRCMMGSPEDEAGRYDDEGPRHVVTLASGFWLMDTPVRQCLWQAVMGNNPSCFKGGDRPVEQVSWTMAQEFLSRLNDRIPGLELALPSEAQWEYACRGGVDAAIYGQDLDQIAWWAGNAEGETHPVGQKLPNAFGLHDMLGNVWEWCADYWHNDYVGAPTDGSAWAGDAAELHVLRGGSWYHDARNVRSANRGVFPHDYRGVLIGFRCARVQS